MDSTIYKANTITRRTFTKGLLLSFGAIAAASCTPVKILFKAFPEEFKINHNLQDYLLRTFAITIVPGADRNHPKLTEIYYDTFYPFAGYVPFFLSDLCSRSKKLFAGRTFTNLSQSDRERVVSDGLHNGDGIIQRLYRGAIYMTRANIYAGIFDDSFGCPHIGFHGTSQELNSVGMFYSDPKRFLAPQISLSGNPL